MFATTQYGIMSSYLLSTNVNMKMYKVEKCLRTVLRREDVRRTQKITYRSEVLQNL